jgi:hypothetical protein
MYDVFISFKNSDAKGNKTTDSMLAERLYVFLTEKKLSVFFSNVELEKRGVAQYKKVIDEALDSSKILIAVGCNKENLESRWVEYEWSGFDGDILSGNKKEAEIFVFYQDMEINDLPRSLRHKQAFNAIEKNALEKLYNFIINSSAYKYLSPNPPETIPIDTQATPSDDIQFEFDAYFLRTSAKEKKDIMRHIEDELNLTEGSLCYEFFNNLLNGSSSDSVSMIEINIARKYFGRTSSDEYESVLNQNNPMELIIEEYFEKVLAALEEPDLAMIILYSLCNCEYSDGLTVSDFKNLTFAPENTIINMLDKFKEQEIIRQIKPIFESPYIMTHDYLIKYLESYCRKRLSEQISANIRDYCDGKKRKRRTVKNKVTATEKRNNESVNEIPLSLYYRNAIDKKSSSNAILFCIRLLCVTIFGVCIMLEINGYGEKYVADFKYEWNHNIHALTILAIGSAIFYIYHYLYYFAKIFFSKMKGRSEFWICTLLILWGMVAVNLALFINGLWATWLAIEWMMIGILHLILSKRTLSNENAKKRLGGEGKLYIVIACVFIALNIMVLKQGYSMSLWFIIFIVFTCLTIRQHINTDFMLAKIGSFVDTKMEGETK